MKKSEFIKFRCSARDKSRVKHLAKLYKYPNVSELILDWILNGAARMNPKRKRARSN